MKPADHQPLINKPAWLARLEEESWQAELIISAAAIFGCLMLPGLFREVEGFVLTTINREAMLIWYVLILFANMLAYTLIITFILHFALRALWIGLVGFNSAYPDGYLPSKKLSEHFQQQLIDDFGDTTSYLSKLDRQCSTIFGAGFSIALLAFGFIISLSIIGLVLFFLRSFLPPQIIIVVLMVIFGFLILFSILSMVMAKKSMQEKAWVKRFHYPMVKNVNRVMMNVGYRPATYVMNVMSSQMIDKKFGAGIVMLISLSFGIAGAGMGISNMRVGEFIDQVYHRYAADPSTVRTAFYADNEHPDLVFHPVIPSYEIYPGELFTIFLPLPNRERYELENQCTLPPANQERRNEEARNERGQRYIACAHAYYRIFINDREIEEFELGRSTFGQQNQSGFLATLFDPPLQNGKNLLRVESQYLNDDGEPRLALIPFYYFAEEKVEVGK